VQYVNFGPTAMKVSRLCLGGMNFGVELDEKQSEAVVHEMIDRGVNFIDTAESYGSKRYSEEYLGRILKGKREDVYLTTKAHNKWARDGRAERLSRENIITSLERSLDLLQTDYLDLYQLHHPDPNTPLEETLATLDRLMDQGKIRHAGVCNHYAWQVADTIRTAQRHDWEPVVSMQYRHNILDRPAEIETVPLVKRFGLATMIYGPLCGGVLSGKYQRGEQPPEESRGAKNPKVKSVLEEDRVYDILDALKPIAEEVGVTLPQLAMMWLLARPEVTTAIMGGTKREHYTLMTDIIDQPLPDEIVERINELSEDRIYRPFNNQPRTQGAPHAGTW